MRIGLAIRLFWKALFDGGFALRIREQLDRPLPGGSSPPAERAVRTRAAAGDDTPVRGPSAPPRSEAISLLAALQREARFVDLVKEPLGSYSDAQVGAAARDVLRDCGRVLDRFFALRPLGDQEEGSAVEVPTQYDPGRYRVIGQVETEPPLRGRLVHHGWIATRCEIPTWSGTPAARLVVAPEEVELSPPPNTQGSPS